MTTNDQIRAIAATEDIARRDEIRLNRVYRLRDQGACADMRPNHPDDHPCTRDDRHDGDHDNGLEAWPRR